MNTNFYGNMTEVCSTMANTKIEGHQDYPSIVKLSNGNYVVVWSSNGQDGSGWGVFGQIFSPNCQKVGGEFRLNDFTPHEQVTFDRINNCCSSQTLVATNGGGFIAVWTSTGQSGHIHNQIFARKFDDKGEGLGAERLVSFSTYSAYFPTIERLSQDGQELFVVSFTSHPSTRIYATILDENLGVIKSPFEVNAQFRAIHEDIVDLKNGNFLLAYNYCPSPHCVGNIYASMYNYKGDLVKNTFRLSEAERYELGVHLTLANNGFIAIFNTADQHSEYGLNRIVASHFDFEGNLKKTLLVNRNLLGKQVEPAIERIQVANEDFFIICWQATYTSTNNANGWDIVCRLIDQYLNLIVSEETIFSALGTQHLVNIAVLSSTRAAITYGDNPNDVYVKELEIDWIDVLAVHLNNCINTSEAFNAHQNHKSPVPSIELGDPGYGGEIAPQPKSSEDSSSHQIPTILGVAVGLSSLAFVGVTGYVLYHKFKSKPQTARSYDTCELAEPAEALSFSADVIIRAAHEALLNFPEFANAHDRVSEIASAILGAASTRSSELIPASLIGDVESGASAATAAGATP